MSNDEDHDTFEHVRHDRFSTFVTKPPLGGLGADDALIDRIVGTEDPDLLRLLRKARKGKPGRPSPGPENPIDSTGFSYGEDWLQADPEDRPDGFEPRETDGAALKLPEA